MRSVTLNGNTYAVPEPDDTGYGLRSPRTWWR
jgi:hypothetical protein